MTEEIHILKLGKFTWIIKCTEKKDRVTLVLNGNCNKPTSKKTDAAIDKWITEVLDRYYKDTRKLFFENQFVNTVALLHLQSNGSWSDAVVL